MQGEEGVGHEVDDRLPCENLNHCGARGGRLAGCGGEASLEKALEDSELAEEVGRRREADIHVRRRGWASGLMGLCRRKSVLTPETRRLPRMRP